MAISKTKINIGIVVVLFMVSGGFYLWPKSEKVTTFVTPTLSINFENKMDDLVSQKSFSKASESLKVFTSSVGPNSDRIDRYIADYYSAKITVESMPIMSHPLAANQYLTVLTSIRNRIEEGTMLLTKENFDENLKNHWASKFSSLVGDINKRLSEVVTFNRISRK